MIFLTKMTILDILSHFWPVFGLLQSLYGRQTLVNCVFTPVLARLNWKTQLGDSSVLQKAKKCIFTPKMAKKWIFERGAQKIFQNEGQIRVQHKKLCQNSEVPEVFENFGPTLLFLPLRSLTTIENESEPLSLKITNLHRKWKIGKTKNMGT